MTKQHNTPEETSASPISSDIAADSAAGAKTSAPPHKDPTAAAKARRSIMLYGLARLGLFLLLTIVIQALALAIGAPVPILISATLALIVALPLSVFVFKGLRVQATGALEQWHTQHKAYKQWVKEELAKR
ncbi:DUF4229 domain-containing protein [Corynebacterium sp. sy017]|uniref:DUF4229 domain-containing protein n=1 Tax=unclassified Corynebacterium TaxID=2624378 RepID=UPI0011851DF0|nr:MULTISPECIES: DUF4229 domain-containing protein [unclassified Corynebacterium]MBP3089301.1 DUF4229 domain-containing protein [Corynebacterium sp. sy017]QDZ43239.1 DUF4229 domain-containing protein [Corynebacterium sp. sy039]TSD90998.1 DUF4229 domain-containing protein [Corynebacterium sp. SY003]